jgi:hypothetical protein
MVQRRWVRCRGFLSADFLVLYLATAEGILWGGGYLCRDFPSVVPARTVEEPLRATEVSMTVSEDHRVPESCWRVVGELN